MPEWWENLQRQGKMAAAVGGLALATLLLYLLIQPLLSNQARLREEVQNRRAELAWMRNAAQEIGQSGAAARLGNAAMPPIQFIDQAARENHLSDQLKRLEPGQGGEIKVWLNNAAYVDLIHWLRQLSGAGHLAITNLNVEKGASPGLVSVQLTLNSGRTP